VKVGLNGLTAGKHLQEKRSVKWGSDERWHFEYIETEEPIDSLDAEDLSHHRQHLDHKLLNSREMLASREQLAQ
jgi:hypothetical protein